MGESWEGYAAWAFAIGFYAQRLPARLPTAANQSAFVR